MPQMQNILLVIASYLCIFLMSNWIAVSVIATYSCIIYFLSIAMDRWQIHKKKILLSGVIFTLLQLAFFKYYDFFRQESSLALDALHLDSSFLISNLLLPLGLSYYSFQSISYLLSRYHQETEVPRFNLPQLLLHFSFFATITAGPIARAKSAKGLTDIQQQPCGMSAQICQTEPRKILYPSLAFALILLALIKKWWIAGWLADHWVNPVFENPMQYHALEVLCAIYGYTLQLFLDFSGYSEMMVAFGLLLGFRLPVNFRAPLLAHNIRDFWDKWHISLSTWIRDYIYIPLGGSRGGFARTQVNLLIAMVLSGVWHGSGWNFFLWGLLHGLGLVLLNIGDKVYEKVRKVSPRESRNVLANTGWLGKVIGTFVTIHFVCFCFVFFRAKSLDEALQVFQALFQNTVNVSWTNNPLYLLSILLISWIAYPFVRHYTPKLSSIFGRVPKYAVSIPLFVVFLLVLICAPSGIPGFIYANF
ncbi:MBOAT family protein [Acinetobacter sp. ME22]|uniref:MBOAT family O-acyltransferase n=1 Tax=Acinetobacter sp. ME22 TaxID=2904802 RepID=UPI001EDAA80D|nr:MBOAT family O-acyltransferase [Acinetobacter sp. ME22]MCG2572141.1 MBOAT family protein [Acinetobacter sp. ME22]